MMQSDFHRKRLARFCKSCPQEGEKQQKAAVSRLNFEMVSFLLRFWIDTFIFVLKVNRNGHGMQFRAIGL